MSDDITSKIGKRVGSINDLPDAIKKQLNIGKLDELEEKIIQTIRDRYEGAASLDEIIVGLYRDFGYITEDRKMMMNKLYRMSKAELLESVPGKKGAYKVK